MLRLKDNKILQLLLVSFITIVIYVYYFQSQDPLTYSFSNLFDGVQYLKAYRYFTGEAPGYSVSFPFHSRIMMPYLASLLPYDALNSFNYLNFIFILAGVLMIFFCWDQLGFPFYLSLAGILWLLLHWVGIIRYNLFDPVTVDVPLYFFQAVFLLAVIKNKPRIMLITAVVSVLDKESIIPLVIVMFLYYGYVWLRKGGSTKNLVFFAAAILLTVLIKSIINHFFPYPEGGRGSVVTLFFHARESLLHPFRIIHWLAGLSVAFGPWLALFILTKMKTRIFTREESIPAVLSVTILAISFLGGGDFTRLIFLGFPFIMTLFFYTFKNLDSRMVYLTLLIGLPVTRFWESIPNPAFKGWWAFYNWHPEFAAPVVAWMWVVYFFMAAAALYFTMRKIQL